MHEQFQQQLKMLYMVLQHRKQSLSFAATLGHDKLLGSVGYPLAWLLSASNTNTRQVVHHIQKQMRICNPHLIVWSLHICQLYGPYFVWPLMPTPWGGPVWLGNASRSTRFLGKCIWDPIYQGNASRSTRTVTVYASHCWKLEFVTSDRSQLQPSQKLWSSEFGTCMWCDHMERHACVQRP